MSKIYHKKPSQTTEKATGANRDLLRQTFAESVLQLLQEAKIGNIAFSLFSIPKARLSRAINDLLRTGLIQAKAQNGDVIINLNPISKIAVKNKFNRGGKQ